MIFETEFPPAVKTVRVPLTPQQVTDLAASGGLYLAPERADTIAGLLGLIGASLAALDQADVDGLEPAAAFDAGRR
jgi:hypothetical protein